jgi:hypothetical protein
MKVAEYRGYEIRLPESGGKAGKGHNKTTSYQVLCDGFILKQFRFIVGCPLSSKSAARRARLFIEDRIKRAAEAAREWEGEKS